MWVWAEVSLKNTFKIILLSKKSSNKGLILIKLEKKSRVSLMDLLIQRKSFSYRAEFYVYFLILISWILLVNIIIELIILFNPFALQGFLRRYSTNWTFDQKHFNQVLRFFRNVGQIPKLPLYNPFEQFLLSWGLERTTPIQHCVKQDPQRPSIR